MGGAQQATESSPGTTRRPTPPLGLQVLAGPGLALDLPAPGFSEHPEGLGAAFVRLIQMSIVPLIFPVVVLSISRVESARAVGRLAGGSPLSLELTPCRP